MPTASGSRIRMAYGVEVTRGVTPANLNLKGLRLITKDINLTKATLQSQEVYEDGQIRDVRHGFNQVVGAFNFELSAAQQNAGTITNWGMDDMLESMLGGTWSATGTAGGSPGTLKKGTSLKTFSFERQFLDLSLYGAYAGVIPGDMTLNFAPASIIGGTINLIGMSSPSAETGVSIQGSGSLTTATSAPPFDTFIGAITEGGSTIAVATGVSLNLKSGRVLSPVIGSKFSPDVYDGTLMVSGTLNAHFQTAALATKFYNEVESSLVLTCNELNTTRQMVFTMNRIKYTGNQKQPPPEGPVIANYPFMALYHAGSSTTIQIDRYL